MPWRLVPNVHQGDCGFRAAAQVLGWTGDDEENMLRLRQQCGEYVMKDATIDELRLGAVGFSYWYWFEATDSKHPRIRRFTHRHEVTWMKQFEDVRDFSRADASTNRLLHGRFREALAEAISTPGNLYWSDHFALNIISLIHRILFFTVLDSGKVTIMPSTLYDQYISAGGGDIESLRIGFLRETHHTAFDAICYMSIRNGCIAAINKQVMADYQEVRDIVETVMHRAIYSPRDPLTFPVTMNALVSESRFMTPTAMVDQKMKLLQLQKKTNKTTAAKYVRDPASNRCMAIGGPLWSLLHRRLGDQMDAFMPC